MSAPALAKQAHRLIQIGVALFLLTSLQGFTVQHFAVPNLGRSVHTLTGFTGLMLLALGLAWPKLKLRPTPSWVAFWFLIYSALATIAGFVIAGLLGAGSSIIPIAAAGARGNDGQELLIQLVMYPAAPTGIIAFALILWGLRGSAE